MHIDIKLGDPVLIDNVEISIKGAGANDPVFERVAANRTLVKGARLEHTAYEKVKSELQSAAATFGYLDARLLRNELQVDPAAHRANVVLELETGERYRFGATTIDQHSVRDPLLRRYLRYSDGEPYDAGKLLRTQFALDDSQFFSSVEVVPGDRDPATHVVPIHISGTGSRNRYEIAPGYDDRDGARITFSYLNPRVNDRGHRFGAMIQASELTRDFNVRYDIPIGDPVLEKFSLQFLTQTQHISGGVDTREATFRPSVTQSFGHWQRTLALNLTHTTTSDVVNGSRVDDLIVPAITYAAVPEGYLGEDLFSRSLYVELLGSHGVLGSNANFLRLDLRGERVLNLDRSLAPAAAFGGRHQRGQQFRKAPGHLPFLRRRRPQRARLRLRRTVADRFAHDRGSHDEHAVGPERARRWAAPAHRHGGVRARPAAQLRRRRVHRLRQRL